MPDLDSARRKFAEQVKRNGRLEAGPLVEAFAAVPREHYLGPGPWRAVEPKRGYQTTPDADPRHLYRDVLIAIDEKIHLNNGHPSSLAAWFNQFQLGLGDAVAHVGCGVGYYTAILAETVGPHGSVLGVEIDPKLANRAARNLAHYPNVKVVLGDGSRVVLGERDAVFVNAGATFPQAAWIDALAEGGRLLLPLTVGPSPGAPGVGHMLRIIRTDEGMAARFISPVGIFPCAGARNEDEEQRLSEAYSGGREKGVRSLRVDEHAREPSCWLHGPGLCLSAMEPGRW